MKTYYVYTMANRSRTLYTGVTNDLERRVAQHKSGTVPGFTSRYQIDMLVFHESFSNVNEAIAWEKRIKGWTRAKKVALIEAENPHWCDLSDGWYDGGRAPADRAPTDMGGQMLRSPRLPQHDIGGPTGNGVPLSSRRSLGD